MDCRLLWCVLCFLDAGCVGGGTGSGRVIPGWQSGSEWSTQTLWENAPFQILFHDIASQKTPHSTPPPPHSLSRQRAQGISSCSTCTFHNRLIQLYTSPPCRELTNSLYGLPFIPPSPSPILSSPLGSTFNTNLLSTPLSLNHVIPPPNSLSWIPHWYVTLP